MNRRYECRARWSEWRGRVVRVLIRPSSRRRPNNVLVEDANGNRAVVPWRTLRRVEDHGMTDLTPMVAKDVLYADVQIPDVAAWCERVFRGGCPYRVWGLPAGDATDGGRVVSAVDVQEGGTFRCEVYRDSVAAYYYDDDGEAAARRFVAALKEDKA